MFTLTQYVRASEIWPTAEDHIDHGYVPGLMRGYNLEVKKGDVVDWLSAEWIGGEPNEEFNDGFHSWYHIEHGFVPTGRVSFRGYGVERYDAKERDFYIEDVTDDCALQIKKECGL